MFFSLIPSLCSAAFLLYNEDNNSCNTQADADDKIIHQHLKHCCAEFQRRPYKNSISFDLQTRLNAACRCSEILKLFCGHKNSFLVTMTHKGEEEIQQFSDYQKSQKIPLALSGRFLRGYPLCITEEHLYLGSFPPQEVSVTCGKQQGSGAYLTCRPSFLVLQF